jgi:molybdopterin-containing oxidoreductase family membrane subunit
VARAWWVVAGAFATLVALGLGAAWVMEEHGHVVTGMTNHVVWGMPHVLAIFLIVAASGALNVASIASAFKEPAYKPYAPLSVLLAVALLAGGLMVLVLDLGRPERLVIAATHYNFRSIFAWNMFLYTGFFAIGVTYLWTMLEKRFGRFSRPAGIAAFAWRIILTTGTGSIFGFLVARQAYAAAVIAPLFIALSLAWGTAAFCIAQPALALAGGVPMGEEMGRRLGRLLALFVIVVLWLTAIYHATNLYWAKQTAFERFILVEGAPYAALFWIGFVALGSLVPLGLLYHPRYGGPRSRVAASLLVVAGAVAFLYVFVIGGQAFPLEIFPGYTASSTFADGVVARYAPSAPEIALGIGGVAAAALITAIGARLFPIMPAAPAPHP